MKRYSDYDDDCSHINWTRFKIIVPTEEDRIEIMQAIEHIHDSDIDTDYVTVNQLSHEYRPLYWNENTQDPSTDPKHYNIIVDEALYNKLKIN